MTAVPVFEDDAEWDKMLGIVESWKGTPYRHLTMVKGRGADCSLFIGAVLLEAGILTRVEHDYYPRDWHLHTHDEIVMDGFSSHIRQNLKEGFEGRFWHGSGEEELMRGDILGFALTKMKVTNHTAMYLGNGMMINSINGRGVSELKYGRFWEERRTVALRIYKWRQAL